MSKYEAVIGLEIHAELKTKSKMFCGCKNDPFGLDLRSSGLDFSNVQNSKNQAPSPKPNTNVCPVCLGMPGTLPVMNKQAIEWTILTGLALNCKIGHPYDRHSELGSESQSKKILKQVQDDKLLYSKWDRKNYFYPDLPKGYQISQYDLPICYEGYLEISNVKFPMSNQAQNPNDKCQTRKIGITRIHLEEDTGTSKHPEGRTEVDYSLLDYNRAGVPLMELVTDPDLRTAKEAKEFCQKYQLILRSLKIADADMEKGQMRCEANISIRKMSNVKCQMSNQCQKSNGENSKQKLGTKVEIKNLNSFKSVEKSIEYEIKRQAEALDSGEKIVQQTRGWDEKKQKTYVMRTKETSADYRYFPEPDLPPVLLAERGTTPNNSFLFKGLRPLRTEVSYTGRARKSIKSRNYAEQNIINIDEIKKQLPELPQEKMKRYIEKYQLKPEDAEVIIGNLEMAEYFEEIVKLSNCQIVKKAADWIINEVSDLSIKPDKLVQLVQLVQSGKISGKIAKEILPEIKKGKSPNQIIKEKGLEQISDSGKIEKIVDEIIKGNQKVVESIKNGKMGAIGFLVGQIMQKTKGQANPKIVNEILRKKLL